MTETPLAIYLDAYGALYRYFRAPGGQRWAARKVLEMCAKVSRERRPRWLASVRDLPYPTRRDEVAAAQGRGYKANRPARPPEEVAAFLEQARVLGEGLEDALGVPTVAVRGEEADDVLATLALRTLREGPPGTRVELVARDKDLMTLVRADGRLVLLDPATGKTTGAAEVRIKFGVHPDQLEDYLVAVGDSSDGVAGIPGVGPAAAREVLREYGTLDTALSRAETGTHWYGHRPGLEKKMREARPHADRARALIRLRTDVPLGFDGLDAVEHAPFSGA